MSDASARRLVALLQSPVLRCRTGILFLPRESLGRESIIAARLGVDAVDYRECLIKSLPPNAAFTDISPEREQARLDAICVCDTLGDCVLIYNLDLALARLDALDRARFWRSLCEWFPHRRRALLLTMPQGASHLLPAGEDLEIWSKDGRFADVPNRLVSTTGETN